MTDKGNCIFAYNNEELDYSKFAIVAAGYIKRNMKHNNTCLITNDINWIKQNYDEEMLDRLFDHIILHEAGDESNLRIHHDSPYTEFKTEFRNRNKDDIFKLSPFDKTLLIDSDYLIQNNFYDYIFDTDIPFSLHKNAIYLGNQKPYLNEINLNEAGIHHWWSTAIYFDKSKESEIFFGIWGHVKDNWEYYSLLYQFPKGLFRTDYCVSIACHILNGMNDTEMFIHDFCGIPLYNIDQKDDVVEVKNLNDWIYLQHDRLEPWNNILSRVKNTNTHLMNKRALSRNCDILLEKMKNE